jgi:hypothetical protein
VAVCWVVVVVAEVVVVCSVEAAGTEAAAGMAVG